MSDILTKQNKSLKSIKEPRLAILDEIKKINEPTEEWRQKQYNQRSQAIKNKHQTICDINEYKLENLNTFSNDINRINLLEQIRNNTNQKSPINAPITESWKQNIRNNKSKLMLAKKRVLINVEQPSAKILKPLEKSDIQKHNELMNSLRTENVLPLWKVNINNERVETIQNKNKISNQLNEMNMMNIKNLLK